MFSKEELRQLKLDFWTLFGARSKYALQNVGRQHWIMYQTEIKGLELKFEVEQHNIKTILEINCKNENLRLHYFEKLTEYRLILNEGFAQPLIWDLATTNSSGTDVSRIYTELTNTDLHKKENWGTIFDFMTASMIQLENNFIEIWDILKEELK